MSRDPHGTQGILRAGAPLADAVGVLILLHGRGASARDILGLGEALAPPGIALLAPEAAGHTWYPYSFLAPREQNEPFLSSALGRVAAALRMATDAGLAATQVAFCGFSQGACMATEYVARHPQRYAGLLAFTGGLIGPLGEPLGVSGDLQRTPVFFSSGDPDPHVPWQRVQESADLLAAMGAVVTVRRYVGRPHTVLQEEVIEASALLRGAFGG